MNERFYGVGEPLIQRQRDQGIDAAAYLNLVAGLGCRALRSWMHLTELLRDPATPDPEQVALHRRLLDRAKEMDIEVTAMSHEWFLPAGCKQRSGHAMPPRDLTPGSLYMQALEMLEQSWYTMVSLFPQVDIWEVGNEWNLNAFLHPDGFLDGDMSSPFTADEKADIAVDMMYFSARGIRRANPKAKVASFSPALSTPGLGGDMPDFLPVMYGVAWTLDKIYRRIKSGNFWSADSDDYFDLVAWHPYVFTNREVKSDADLFLNVQEPDELLSPYSPGLSPDRKPCLARCRPRRRSPSRDRGGLHQPGTVIQLSMCGLMPVIMIILGQMPDIPRESGVCARKQKRPCENARLREDRILTANA